MRRSGPLNKGGFLICTFVLLLAGGGCTAKHYRRAADKEVYTILQEAEQKVFGRTDVISIETMYSDRDPEEISPEELIADRSRGGERFLTIEEALELAVYNSRRYQTEKERLYLTALNLSGERYNFGPQFFAGGSANLDRLAGGEVLGTANSRVGVNQLLMSGGRVGLTIANDLLRYYTGDPRRSAISSLSVNLFQPLLRGFGPYNPSVEALTQAERNLIYAVRDFSFFQDAFAVEVVNDYFDLLAQQDIVRNRYTNYLSRVEATRRLEARADRERSIDVDQSRQAELGAKNDYINTVAGYLNSLDAFKVTLGLPIDERLHLDDQPLQELAERGLIPVSIPTDLAFRLAIERQLPILNAIDTFEDAKRKIKVAANQLLPDLNILADASVESDRPTDYTTFDPDNIRAGVGVELDLPIDRLRQRNNYRATLISFEAELRNLTLTLDNLKVAIERGLRTLEQRRQSYIIQQGALVVANRRVDATSQSVEAGRVEVRDLIEAQDAQVAAQNAVIASLVNYQQALLQLALDIGVLETESSRFWLKDQLASHIEVEFPPEQAPVRSEELVPPHLVF